MLLADAFDHVVDSKNIDIFESLGWTIHLPYFLTKFMVLELVAAGLILAIFIPLAKRAESGDPPRGWFANAFESLLTFIRDRVAKPTIGEHDADRFVPYLWTVFLFILFCNLLGIIPFLGSPTASFAVTGALALVAFLVIHGSAIAKMGFAKYAKAQYPHIDAPFGLGPVIALMIVGIEVFGHFIKAFVLAMRLFANLFAGHLVLAFILTFIVMAKNTHFGLFGAISVGSVAMVVALSLLEIFIAFLQAFIFTYLTAVFMGMALHPQH
jgi:F-type H+-transporting ATPase subunit a